MQYDVGGGDFFGGPITRFDIPLLWHAAVDEPSEYVWQVGLLDPKCNCFKGVSFIKFVMLGFQCSPCHCW